MAPKLLIKVRLTGVRDEAEAVRSFTFEPVVRHSLPPWRGGAHVILRLPNGLRRSYSLCGDPNDTGAYQIAVLHEPDGRGGSDFLHRHAQVGDEMFLTHPQDDFALDPDAARHVLIAGGIGITPMVGMLRGLSAGTPTELHYCVPGRHRAAFLDVLAGLTDVRLHSSRDGTRLDLAELLAEPDEGTHVYCCGPRRLMTAFRAATAHWPDGTVHTEQFAGIDPVAAHQGDPFDVELTVTGRKLHVPADRSLLDVLKDDGVPVESSCEAGICRTCVVYLAGGTPVHRDLVLSTAQREKCLLSCVSRGDGVLRLAL